MKCHSLEDALVEVARGRPVGHGTAAAVETHVEHCAACAARLERQRQLTAALRTLAATTDDEVPSEALERRLLAAFESSRSSTAFPTRQWRPAMAAAAGLAVIAGLAWWQIAVRSTPPSARSIAGAVPSPAEVRTPASPPSTPVASAHVPPAPSAGHRSTRRNHGRLVQAEGFVMLPAAIGLPDFESGEIVRMELPLASLPAYGIEIVPDAGPAPVQADLLIGQDGQARAIRLVTQVRTRPGAEQ